MTIRLSIHPVDPQRRLLYQAAELLRNANVIALPTDACYVLASGVSHKSAVERMRALRQLGNKHLLSLMCSDLKQVASYAQVDNTQYRFLREWTPGPYTFILPATKETPRRIWHPSRKTIGLRVPDSPIAQGVVRELDEPLLVTSLILPDGDDPLHDADEIIDQLGSRIDAVIDAGGQGYQPTTVIDLTGNQPVVEREGLGPTQGMV